MGTRYLLLALLIVAISVSSCAEQKGPYTRDGKEYGKTSGSFSGRWWNYYERGRSFADGRFYKKAIADFQQAIAGRSQDQWQARTYGMHFVDYFPRRELGIVHFQRKDYNKAITELEHSIENAPSAKAHYFLNKARAARITRYGNDMRPPGLILADNTTQKTTNKFTWTIKGVATDDTFVAAIKVGAQQIPMELAEKKKVFTAEVPLNEGPNIIRVTATDLAGKSTEQSIEIYCDRQGPQIEIEELTVENNRVTVKGSVSDNKGMSSLRINNKRWPITGRAPGYNFKVVLPEGRITIVAKDRAGNITRAVVRKNEFNLQQVSSHSLAGLKFAGLTADETSVASDAGIPRLEQNSSPVKDKDAPYIWMEDIDPIQHDTFDDMILLEGRVSDSSLLVYITINGEPILNRKGRKIFFSLLKKLQKGKNTFHIVAADEYGNKVDKIFTVNRKIRNIRQIGSRMSVAILPFDRKGELSQVSDIVHDQLIDSFLEQARFNILERQKIDAILRELKLSTTQLVNPTQVADLGKIVAAQSMLAGTVIESQDSIEIIGRLIDTETAMVLSSNDIYGEDKGLASVADLLDNLAFKFKRDFPLVEGILLEVKDGEVLIDVGKEQQIRPNTRLICYREGPPIRHPVTGKLLGSKPQVIGKLKVETVYEDFSRAEVLSQNTDFIVSDKVIAQ